MKGASAHIGAGTCAELFGFQLCTDPRAQVLETLLGRLNRREMTHVLTLNPEMLLLSHNNPAASQILKAANIVVADGAGIVWAVAQLQRRRIERLPGVDLAFHLLRALAGQGGSVYLLGAAKGVAEEAAARLTAALPGLRIAGCQHGFFEPDEEAALVAAIAGSGADLLLVGMGCPRQEGFIVAHRAKLNTPLMIGVGGALEVFAGAKRRAPAFIQKLCLEWLWRALSDPVRFRRLSVLPAFILLVLREKRRLARQVAA